jgi:hypothetical protein
MSPQASRFCHCETRSGAAIPCQRLSGQAAQQREIATSRALLAMTVLYSGSAGGRC